MLKYVDETTILLTMEKRVPQQYNAGVVMALLKRGNTKDDMVFIAFT